MKHRSKFSRAAMAVTAASLLATACSDPEGEPYQGGSEPGTPVDITTVKTNAVYTTPSHNQLVATQIGSYEMAYNLTALPVSIGPLSIVYSKAEVAYLDGYGKARFGIDARGYITSMNYTENARSNATVQSASTGTINISYSPRGFLTSWQERRSTLEKDLAAGIDRTVVTTTSCTLQWEAGELQSVSTTVSQREGYVTITTTTTADITGSVANPLGQYTMSYAELLPSSSTLGLLSLGGLLGTAPTRLPTRIFVETTSSNDPRPKATAEAYKYTFNSNSTISTEASTSTLWAYIYQFVD